MEQLALQLKFIDEQLVQSSRELRLSGLMIQKQATTAWAVTAMMNWKFVRQMRQWLNNFLSQKKSRNSDLKGKREREQFHLPIAHAMTVHKSQGSTIIYFTEDMDLPTKNPKYQRKIDKAMF